MDENYNFIGPFNADQITMENFEGIIKCRKKPVIVHALQLNFQEGFQVTTLEGVVTGRPGDYLMFGVDGEKYPCRKEIFEKSYDIVNDEDDIKELEKDGE